MPHFHLLHASSSSPWTGKRDAVMLLKRKDLDPLIFRWKKTTRALKVHEQPYGKCITDILEMRTDSELARFSDPVEAAAFFCLLELAKTCWPTEPSACRHSGVPEQCTLAPEYRMS